MSRAGVIGVGLTVGGFQDDLFNRLSTEEAVEYEGAGRVDLDTAGFGVLVITDSMTRHIPGRVLELPARSV